MKRTLSLVLVLVFLLVSVPAAFASWTGGHDVMGAPQPQKTWYFAEGCTRVWFNTWLCIFNPNGDSAEVAIQYFLEN